MCWGTEGWAEGRLSLHELPKAASSSEIHLLATGPALGARGVCCRSCHNAQNRFPIYPVIPGPCRRAVRMCKGLSDQSRSCHPGSVQTSTGPSRELWTHRTALPSPCGLPFPTVNLSLRLCSRASRQRHYRHAAGGSVSRAPPRSRLFSAPLASAAANNQKRPQTLPHVPWGTRLSPGEQRPSTGRQNGSRSHLRRLCWEPSEITQEKTWDGGRHRGRSSLRRALPVTVLPSRTELAFGRAFRPSGGQRSGPEPRALGSEAFALSWWGRPSFSPGSALNRNKSGRTEGQQAGPRRGRTTGFAVLAQSRRGAGRAAGRRRPPTSSQT